MSTGLGGLKVSFMDHKKGIDDMKTFTKKERSQLDTCLEKVIAGEDGIYIPTRVMKSNKLTFEQKTALWLVMYASEHGGSRSQRDSPCLYPRWLDC